MRTLYFSIACVLLFATVSCQKSLENCNVCDGLLRNGAADSASFVKLGTDWEFKNFAYTPNGIDIVNKEALLPGFLRTTHTDTLLFYFANEGSFLPTFFTETNKLTMQGGPHTMLYAAIETPIIIALQNAVCYAIKGDLLYIHFKEFEGKNLFILQRK